MSEREKFEAWYRATFKTPSFLSDGVGGYHSLFTERAWLAWAAARSALAQEAVPPTARAFEIADDAMYVQLRSYGWKRGGNAEVQYVYPPSPDSSCAAEVNEAVEWLLPRGFLERGEDVGGSFVRVLREPGAAPVGEG